MKPICFDKSKLKINYVNPLKQMGMVDDVVAVTIEVGKTTPMSMVKECLAKLLPSLDSIGTKVLYCTDGTYFKALTKKAKAEPYSGYVLPCAIKGYEHFSVVLGLNYQQLIYNPELQGKLDISLLALHNFLKGTYTEPGIGIIHSAYYPKTYEEIRLALRMLLEKPELTCDIEAFSLRFEQAGIGTISFAWDEHNGIAFPVDYFELSPELVGSDGHYGKQQDNKPVKELLKQFFEEYKGNIKGTTTFHNASYDVKVLIYELWMKNMLDNEGLLTGLDIMCENMNDTKIIAYLAYNSTAGNVLRLKALAHEFAGNYAVDDIHDIRLIPLPKLLEYNLVDSLSTFYIKKRDYPKMVNDKQEDLYKGLMLDSLKLLIQVELSGMPIDMDKVNETDEELKALSQTYIDVINNSWIIKDKFTPYLQTKMMNLANSKLKTKQHTIEKFSDVTFNPNSGPQLQELLYTILGLPVLDYTDTKQPATGADTLKKLTKHTTDQSVIDLIEALIGFSSVEKIVSSFLPAFKKATLKEDGNYYLHGSFNIGGTVSGRLSSSNPNLQNLPAGSTFGKLIKKCFKAPEGWLFGGADFSSLEDYISALTTKDPNKLIIYEQGMDSHAFRAMSYFKKQIPEYSLATAGDRCFRVTDSKGENHFIKCGTLVSCPNGETLPIEKWIEKKDAYALEKNKGLL